MCMDRSCRAWMRRLQMIDFALADTVLYLDYGANEMIWHKGMNEILPTIVGALYRRGIPLTFRIVPEGEHCEACWEKQLPFAFNTLLYKRNF